MEVIIVSTDTKCTTGGPIVYTPASRSVESLLNEGMNGDPLLVNYSVQSESESSIIKDSGQRREFESGAVRDIVEGKGRCDLVPLSSAAILIFSSLSPVPDIDYIDTHIEKIVLKALDEYISRFNEGIEVQERQLSKVVQNFLIARGWSRDDAFLEVSKHYEEGAKKYGEYNWQKGIPCHSYIDSAIRHLMKWCRGDNDEPHDRAFLWNILSLHWTTVNHPELVDFIKS